MRKPFIVLLTLAVLAVAACKSDNDVNDPPHKKGENFLFYTSKDLFNSTLQKRSDEPGNAFKIESVVRDGDILEVTVSHAGGCTGDFSFYWDGSVMESYPEQINIFLRFPGACGEGSDTIERVLKLDINEFINRPDLSDRAMFHIINGSMITSDNDMNSSSSN